MTTTYSTDLVGQSNPSWRARFRFVRDLAPAGGGIFMAPDRSMVLRLFDHLYMRAPMIGATVVIAWFAVALLLWPVISIIGFAVWTSLLGAALALFTMGRMNAPRPMRRPGAASAWANEHITNLWLLFLALGSASLLVFPDASVTHQQVLFLTLVCAGGAGALFSSSSVRGLAATLAPTMGLPAVILIVRGQFDLAAPVALAGGIAVLAGIVIFHLTSAQARNDVETA